MSISYSVVISVLYLASGVFIFLLGLTILRIGQSSAPTRAAALMLFFAGIGPLLSATGLFIEGTLRPGSVVYHNMVENFEYLWEFYFPSLMLFALSFPREHAILRKIPFIGFLLFFPYIFHLAMMMFGDRMLDFASHLERVFPSDREVSVGSREVAVGGIDNVVDALVRMLEKIHRNLFSVVNIIYSFTAIYLLSRTLGRVMNPRLARQMRTVLAGLSMSIIAYVVTKFFSWTYPRAIPRDVSLALVNFSLVMSGGTIAFAVVKQQFLGIRHVIRRAILYSAVAVLFATAYLVVVRPVSEFFGQYSGVGKDAFETGFIVLAIIAFQPTLIRTEELLGKLLLKGRVDKAMRFKNLATDVSTVSTIEELERVLKRGFREIIDTSLATLRLCDPQEPSSRLSSLLETIGEPIRRTDLTNFEQLTKDDTEIRGPARRIVPRRRGKKSILDDIIEESPEIENYEVVVPIVKEKRCVGFVGLGEKIYGVPYDSEELAHLSVLATQIASALQNIKLLSENVERKLIEEELKIARKIQTQLLPGSPPKIEGFDLSAVTVPSRYVGGDYYDFVLIDDRWLVLVVADVSGKGIPASILTATLQAAVRSNADAQTDPETMMKRLNKLLFENTSASEFATLFYCVVDLKNGNLKYANAGHDFPFMVNGSGAEILPESGIVLGCLEEFSYRVSKYRIPEDGVLVIYTDGVTESESRTGEYYGTERLQRSLVRFAGGNASEICERVIDDVRRFSSSDTQDDLTLVALKRCS
jgi:sigma-B regulation protein RsbU (phosphoserine phosphatase)